MAHPFKLHPPISATWRTTLTTRPEHCDIYGHVNNAAYLVLFEEARWDFITAGGWGPDRVQAEQVGPVILDLRLRFKREIERDETITIETWATEAETRLFTLQQRMRNAKGDECCLAEIVFCLFDLKARRMIPLTEAWKQGMQLLPQPSQA